MVHKEATSQSPAPLSPLEFHTLLVLAPEQLYGYAIKKGVKEQSQGAISPEIGSLYRALTRLMERGWVQESQSPPEVTGPHRGKPRKYYRITPEGLVAAKAEMRRLRGVVQADEDLPYGCGPAWTPGCHGQGRYSRHPGSSGL
jgi:DNA-binding PadR family transcriptional regulator